MRIPNIVGVAANILTDDNEYGFGIFDDNKLLSIHIIDLLYADIVELFLQYLLPVAAADLPIKSR